MTTLARELGQRLERDGFSAAVINPRFVKPIDREMLAAYARRVAAFVTFEDHVKMGGFGSAVVEALQEMGMCRSRGPHRLARSIYRARQDRVAPRKIWPHRRRGLHAGGALAALAQTPHTGCELASENGAMLFEFNPTMQLDLRFAMRPTASCRPFLYRACVRQSRG